MSNTFKIGSVPIGKGHPPFIIAEMSGNHNQSLEKGLQIIDAAAAAGAQAVKLQTYTADTITLDIDTPEFRIADGLWKGRTLHNLYEWAHTPWDWHQPLFDHAHKREIMIFSSPFDTTAVDLLEDLNAPAYKIASFEAVDLALIRYAASTGKPLIISTGMADADEIEEAVEAARDGGCEQLALLHCVSGYPAPASDYNLRTIPDMMDRFGLVCGLSDHTLDNTSAVASVALGASIIEKHFTLDRNGGGPDDSFSLEPKDFKALCLNARSAWEALGQIDYGRKSSEKGNVKFRRSLYFVKNLEAGDIIGPNHIRSIRPGYGLAPKYLNEVIGKKVVKNIPRGTAVTRALLS